MKPASKPLGQSLTDFNQQKIEPKPSTAYATLNQGFKSQSKSSLLPDTGDSQSQSISRTKRRIKEFHSKPLMLNGMDPYKLRQTLEEKPYLSLY